MTAKNAEYRGLTMTERLIVWIGLLVINPLVTFIIALLLWRGKEPHKWSDFVGIIKWYLGIFIGLALLGVIAAAVLVSVNPKTQIEKARQSAREATSSYELNIQTE